MSADFDTQSASAGLRTPPQDLTAEEGVLALDASVGGFGGCPFAPNATGNIATEDLVYALGRSGVDTGLDVTALADPARFVTGALGADRTPGLLDRAGAWPG